MTGTGGWGEGRGSPESAALGRGHCRASLRLLQSPPRRQGRGRAAGGLDAPHLTFHHHFLWQAEAHLRRLPSACLGLNMSCGACQGLLAPSWVWHHQLCAQPRPWLVPVQPIPLRGEQRQLAPRPAPGEATRPSPSPSSARSRPHRSAPAPQPGACHHVVLRPTPPTPPTPRMQSTAWHPGGGGPGRGGQRNKCTCAAGVGGHGIQQPEGPGRPRIRPPHCVQVPGCKGKQQR